MGIKTVRVKIEKRVLERIGHIMRMEDGRLTKVATLGWIEDLEDWEKPPGRRKKTVLYWKRLLREAGLDPTDVDALTRDRKGWKETVNKRIKHLEQY